jgi:hypothetical protein
MAIEAGVAHREDHRGYTAPRLRGTQACDRPGPDPLARHRPT